VSEELTGQPASFLPHYDPPGLSIRATFLATDGSKPQEIILEWRNDPGRDTLDFALDAIMDMARPSEVHTVVERAGKRPRRVRPTDGPFRRDEEMNEATFAPDETARLPRQFCDVQGPGHDEEGHWCTLFVGHEPVEPGGRAHRCRCGGIFATDQEVPDVPGRETQRRRRSE
jgi:hypothetical protein